MLLILFIDYIIYYMENKILNKTSLTGRKVLYANLLKNKFITWMYVILTVIFLGLAAYQLAVNTANSPQFVVHITFAFVSLVFAFVIPAFSAFSWRSRAKKNYGTTNMDVEYQFNDISLRLIYDGKVIDKFDYHDIYKTIKKKDLFLIVGSSKLFIIDINGFNKANALEKVEGYIKRFTK